MWQIRKVGCGACWRAIVLPNKPLERTDGDRGRAAFAIDGVLGGAEWLVARRRSTQSLAVMNRQLGIAFASITLAGCFPYLTSYVHLDAPGAKTVGGCAGPPVFVTYEANGARVALTLEPGAVSKTTEGYLRVRAPESTAVSLPDPVGYITPEGQAPTRFELKQFEPPWERTSREFLRRQGILEHRYQLVGLPTITSSGALRLPVIFVNGVAVESPVFKFDRRPYAGVVPLNC